MDMGNHFDLMHELRLVAAMTYRRQSTVSEYY